VEPEPHAVATEDGARRLDVTLLLLSVAAVTSDVANG